MTTAIGVFADLKPFFFVTFNTHKRRRFLANHDVHNSFVTFCYRAHEEHDVAVGRYVIMPDHVHLFVSLGSIGMTLPQWIKALRAVIGKDLLHLGIEKPQWQEGFFDHLLRSDERYGQKWEYVRMNPVRAGLCAHPEEWPYQGEIVGLKFC
jgi:REP-associated tyrosine transposase